MMHGHEKSDLVIVAMKPANKARKAHCGGICGGGRSGVGGAKGGGQVTAEASAGVVVAVSVERRAGAKGNTHQQSTYWTPSQVRVSQALARIRQLVPSRT
jgi:hypothetical protein